MRSRVQLIEDEVQEECENGVQSPIENAAEQLEQVDRQHSVRSRKITIRDCNSSWQLEIAIHVRHSSSQFTFADDEQKAADQVPSVGQREKGEKKVAER